MQKYHTLVISEFSNIIKISIISQGNKTTINISQGNKTTLIINQGNKTTINISQGNKTTINISQGNKTTNRKDTKEIRKV